MGTDGLDCGCNPREVPLLLLKKPVKKPKENPPPGALKVPGRAETFKASVACYDKDFGKSRHKLMDKKLRSGTIIKAQSCSSVERNRTGVTLLCCCLYEISAS